MKETQVKDEENGNTTCDRVVDLLFSSEKCMVSEAALQLMKLVHQTLKVSAHKLETNCLPMEGIIETVEYINMIV